MASHQGGRQRPAGIRDVARAAGVSVASASFALNGQPGVAEDTRRRILAAAEKLGYRANAQAQALRRGRTTIYGIVVRNFANPFFLGVLAGAEEIASECGATLLVLDSRYSLERERLHVREMAAQRLAGLAIASVGTGQSIRLWQELRAGAPVVALNTSVSNARGVSRVCPDYTDPAGRVVDTGHEDRLVILFSHHGTGALTNDRHPGPGGEPVLRGSDILALLHRFPNVVLWLNGHTHTNAVRARRDPGDPARGFWEVTTCAVVDWPCQTRLVELTDAGDHLAIICTMADHDTPLAPSSLATGDDLAALHRELAANVPLGGDGSGLAGTPPDRNVELRLRPPFPLRRLAGA